jgi:hypothetical protein
MLWAFIWITLLNAAVNDMGDDLGDTRLADGDSHRMLCL